MRGPPGSRIPHATRHPVATRRDNKHPFAYGLLLLLTALFLPPASQADTTSRTPPLPALGESSSRALTIEQERRLGRDALNEIHRKLPVLQDPLSNAYLSGLGEQLLTNTQHARFRFEFLIINAPEINAFAAPGGVIAVNTGLIKAANNEAELAAVIAHEIAHVTQRHIARTLDHSAQLGVPSLLVALGAILAGIHDPALGQAALASTIAGNAQSQLNFSRAYEREADEIGMQTLADTGLDPTAMAGFFAELSKRSHTDENTLPSLLLTHPVTSDRIAESSARSAQYHGDYRRNSLRFSLFKARIIALTGPPEQVIERLTRSPNAAENPAQRYREAIALSRAGRNDEAITLLEALHQAHPKSEMLTISLAQVLTSARRADLAVKLLRHLDALYPEQTLVITSLARALLASGNAKAAYALLTQHMRGRQNRADVLHLLAEAAAASGNSIASHEALAQYYVELGEYTPAAQQIEIALQQHPIDHTTRARLIAEKTRIAQQAKLDAME